MKKIYNFKIALLSLSIIFLTLIHSSIISTHFNKNIGRYTYQMVKMVISLYPHTPSFYFQLMKDQS